MQKITFRVLLWDKSQNAIASVQHTLSIILNVEDMCLQYLNISSIIFSMFSLQKAERS